MAKFLTTSGVTHALEEIITDAEETIVLVSPYWQLPDIFKERLRDAINKGVKVVYFIKIDKLNKKQISDLKDEIPKLQKQLKNIEIVPVENLHAKCYHNERKMIITSMNLYDYSIKNNREMGILIDYNEDKAIFQDALKEIQSIKSNALHKIFDTDNALEITNQAKTSKTPDKSKASNSAYCIRCGENIKFNPDKPFCPTCFGSWVEWENPDYEENWCHACGKESDSSMNKPLCYSCYKKHF